MRLAIDSHIELEKFFRAQFNEPSLTLPPIKIHAAAVIDFLLRVQGIGAITLGTHIFVDSNCLRRDETGRAAMPDWLMVHEATHVLQFAREGWGRFLHAYLRDYFSELRAQMKNAWRAKTRLEAYLAIAHEREARDMEENFKAWRKKSGESGESSESKAVGFS